VSDQDELVEAASSMVVVRGTLDDDELAALVAGVVAMAGARQEDDEPGSPTSAWMDRARTMRGVRGGVLGRGTVAWRHSLR
jgi:hypothetical protein